MTAAKTRGDDFLDAVREDMDAGIARVDQFLLAQAARTLTEIEKLEQDVDENGVTITGARGQVIANPSLAALSKHRTLFAKLFDTLFGQNLGTSEAARVGARARWNRA